jgi:hypothetical protein
MSERGESLSERVCPKEFVRKSLSERVCPKEFVRKRREFVRKSLSERGESLSERVCPKEARVCAKVSSNFLGGYDLLMY